MVRISRPRSEFKATVKTTISSSLLISAQPSKVLQSLAYELWRTKVYLGEDGGCDQTDCSKCAHPSKELPSKLLPVDTASSLQQADTNNGTCKIINLAALFQLVQPTITRCETAGHVCLDIGVQCYVVLCMHATSSSMQRKRNQLWVDKHVDQYLSLQTSFSQCAHTFATYNCMLQWRQRCTASIVKRKMYL